MLKRSAHNIHGLDRLTEALNKKGANAGYSIYPALEHMETVMPTLEEAISAPSKF